MMKNIYIGIDGGATAVKVRVEDEHGRLLGKAMGGPANIRLSVTTSWQAIYQAIEEVLQINQMSLQDKHYRFHVGMGLAGCELPEVYEEFIAQSHPFAALRVVSDAHAACLGAHQGQEGAIIIVGTGIIGYQIEDEKKVRVGGWGFPHDDGGSGAWLGLEATRLTFQWLDHRIDKNPLVDDIFAFFNHNLGEFTTWANRANSTEFAKLAPIVINHAQQQEAEAVRLLKKSAHMVDRIAVALEKQRFRHEKNDMPLRCALLGGIAPFIEPWLDAELRARLVTAHSDAMEGAILLIKKEQAAVCHPK